MIEEVKDPENWQDIEEILIKMDEQEFSDKRSKEYKQYCKRWNDLVDKYHKSRKEKIWNKK